jgi:hypothetical protein
MGGYQPGGVAWALSAVQGSRDDLLRRLFAAAVHGFDICSSVENVAELLQDDRLVHIPGICHGEPVRGPVIRFRHCHRLLRHMPDPAQALCWICTEVRPGGVLFVHAYKRSWRHGLEWRYKYRLLTTRMPYSLVYRRPQMRPITAFFWWARR